MVIEGPAGPSARPVGARPVDYGRPLPPGADALHKLDAMIDVRPAWYADRESLLAALDQSIRYFTYPSSRRHYPVQSITHAQAAASLAAFREILTESPTPDAFQARIEDAFDVYESVGCDNAGTVLFTGYYTPIFEASRTPTDVFRWPLYRMPPDLVKDDEGNCLGRRTADGGLVPYYTRGEIAAGALAGHELVYLASRFDAYICTIQGSAKLRLRDGTLMGVGYAAHNGKPYTSVGRRLVADGLLAASELSLAKLRRFFRRRPELTDAYLPLNERYVFFRETDAPPTGSLGLPVTPLRSLATDKRLFPRGALCLVDTELPKETGPGVIERAAFRHFMLDQDTGGAIRAPGRADIYVGVGDAAGRIAGATYAEGRLYYLFLKPGRASGS
jgi:membrane-bound lytic murein transglycosylase A